jgi:NAD(P) transhydrogenase subunit alpha
MELVPRISRAQKLDALSAMSSIGGYRDALRAAERLPKFFPLLTTAAGTVRPARVLVLGAGVAGLQAIATAKRLGAKVFGYDIREPTREEVESLGASFVDLEVDIEADQDESGYAEELEKEKQERQPELLQPHLAKADVVISTALIPGRPAPLLINENAVEAMDPGSVIVDLAAPNGGNCAYTETGEEVVAHDVQILGPTNLPAEMPVHASELYAKTVMALIEEGLAEGAFAPDFEDQIFAESCLTREGKVQNERVRGLLEPEEKDA